MRVLPGFVLVLAGCANPNPWREIGAGEAKLAEAAQRAAWTSDFLTSPGRLEEVPRERKDSQVESLRFSTFPLATKARLFVIGDPTENREPPMNFRVILVQRREEDQVLASVVTPDTYFKAIFQVFGGIDPQPNEFYECCAVYARLFGCDSPPPFQTRILFTAGDIPTSPENPLPADMARRIAAPSVKYEFRGGEPFRIRFDCVLQGWELYTGHLSELRFALDYCEAVEQSTAQVTCHTLSKAVGLPLGLK